MRMGKGGGAEQAAKWLTWDANLVQNSEMAAPNGPGKLSREKGSQWKDS
jgi:hypothetical protein